MEAEDEIELDLWLLWNEYLINIGLRDIILGVQCCRLGGLFHYMSVHLSILSLQMAVSDIILLIAQEDFLLPSILCNVLIDWDSTFHLSELILLLPYFKSCLLHFLSFLLLFPPFLLLLFLDFLLSSLITSLIAFLLPSLIDFLISSLWRSPLPSSFPLNSSLFY